MPERRVIIDHLTIGVSDLERSRVFYAQALAPLGFEEIGPWSEHRRDTAFGTKDANDFAISQEYEVGGQVHIAFAADTREQVSRKAKAARLGEHEGERNPR